MIVCADARHIPLRDQSVQCVVTSPPYFGLRDYGNPNQIGLEETPDAYVAQMVTVFREVWRVLRDDGTLWLNLGDSYAAGGNGVGSGKQLTNVGSRMPPKRATDGLKSKDLVGIPWRVAFALQADGWYLRSDIIWAKPNPMPESVTDRPTRSHEYIFLLSKQEKYYYDYEAIKEDAVTDSFKKWTDSGAGNDKQRGHSRRHEGFNGRYAERLALEGVPTTRNKRSVWTVATQPVSDAHFATFPEALIEPCILAGCPMGGIVLDPFIGSGTVGVVANRIGRQWVGTDLSYFDISRKRTRQMGLLV